jgi:hypothetical protein
MALAFNSQISRGSSYADNPGSGAANLIPTEQAQAIMSAVPRGSAALQMFNHIPMGRYQERVPVLSVLPQGQFVNGEMTAGTYANGLKATSYADWKGRYLTAEEIAVIVPVAENVIADSDYDILGNLTPLIAEAIGRALDQAVFFGYNKPASYPAGIVEQAIASGHVVTAGTAAQSAGSLAADIANLFAAVESDGFDVTGVVARMQMRSRVRNARTTFGSELTEINVNDWYGQPVAYALRGLWPTYSPSTVTGNTTGGSPVVTSVSTTTGLSAGDAVTGAGIPAGTAIQSVDSASQVTLTANATATASGVTVTPVAAAAVAGDMSQALLGVRSDISYKILDQAVLTDGSGNIQFNLAQQDAIAIRVVARFGFAVANAVTYDNPNEATRWPFAVLQG